METLNDYFKFINLKAFCENYGLNYEFTRQVLQGKRTLTEKFRQTLLEHIHSYHIDQQNYVSLLTPLPTVV